MVALILGPIPYIGILGGIIAIIGAILFILGGGVFGKKHSNYVILSVGAYVAGLVIIFAFVIGFAVSLVSTALSGVPPTPETISASFNNLLIGAIIGGAITGIASVLFTYQLQKPTGRILLWTAYVTGLAIGILVARTIFQQLDSVIQQAFSGGMYDPAPLEGLQAQQQTLALLNLIPSMIYAVAYYMAWSRISRGEIPETPAVQPAP